VKRVETSLISSTVLRLELLNCVAHTTARTYETRLPNRNVLSANSVQRRPNIAKSCYTR